MNKEVPFGIKVEIEDSIVMLRSVIGSYYMHPYLASHKEVLTRHIEHCTIIVARNGRYMSQAQKESYADWLDVAKKIIKEI